MVVGDGALAQESKSASAAATAACGLRWRLLCTLWPPPAPLPPAPPPPRIPSPGPCFHCCLLPSVKAPALESASAASGFSPSRCSEMAKASAAHAASASRLHAKKQSYIVNIVNRGSIWWQHVHSIFAASKIFAQPQCKVVSFEDEKIGRSRNSNITCFTGQVG